MRLMFPIGLGPLVSILLALGCVVGRTSGQEETPAATRQYAAAVRFQNLESYDLAAEEWSKFLKQYKTDPRAPKAAHYLGVCYFQNNQLDKALAAFQNVIATYPDFELIEATYLYLGVTQFTMAQEGKPDLYAAAVKTFNTLATKFPKGKHHPQALYYLGECAYMTDNKQEAIRWYSELIRGYPNHELLPDAFYALGVAQEETSQQDAAGKSYDAFLQKFPNHPLATEIEMRRGETLFAAGQFREAAARFGKAAATQGFDLADYATLRQAEALAQLRQYTEAAGLYAAIPERFPRSEHAAAARLASGKCYYLAGQYAQARQVLERAVQAGGPSAPEAAHWVAQCLMKENQPDQALAAVEKMLPSARGNPFEAQLLMDQADAIYEIPQRRPEAIRLYAELAARHPDDPIAPQALYMAAFASLEQGEHDTALKHAQAFLAKHAEDELAADVWHVAAEANLQLGRPGEAEKVYGQLRSRYANHPDAELWKVRQALCLQLQKKFQETVAALEPAIEEIRTPDLAAEARYLIGSSQVQLDQYDAAVKWLEASLASQPKWRRADETLLALAQAYRELGEHDKAAAALRKLIAEFPNSPALDRAHYRLGEYAYTAGDYQTAVAEYRAVIDRWPESPLVPHALHELGCAQLNQKDAASAEKTLGRLIGEFPQHALVPRARFARGMARQQLGQYPQAVEDLQAMLATNPEGADKSDARYVLGLCQMGLKQYDAAAETFRGLLADDPSYAATDNALYQLAWALSYAGKEAEAAQQFAQLAQKFPESPLFAEAQHHVGEYAYNQKDYNQAAAAYYAAMNKAGKTELGEKAAHKLSWSYFHLGQYDKAHQTFHYQLVTYPNGPLAPDALFMRAECLFKLEKFKEALAAYQQVKGVENEDFQVLTLLHGGQAAAQLGQLEEALRWLSSCTEQFPDSPHAPEALYEQGWVVQNQEKLDEALKLYQQAIDKANQIKKPNQEAAARAQFMIGEIQFQKKEHSEAVRSFFRVAYGYSYPQWQGEASYEAARCFEVLGQKTQALKMYRELVEKFPDHEKAELAKKRIQELGG